MIIMMQSIIGFFLLSLFTAAYCAASEDGTDLKCFQLRFRLSKLECFIHPSNVPCYDFCKMKSIVAETASACNKIPQCCFKDGKCILKGSGEPKGNIPTIYRLPEHDHIYNPTEAPKKIPTRKPATKKPAVKKPAPKPAVKKPGPKPAVKKPGRPKPGPVQKPQPKVRPAPKLPPKINGSKRKPTPKPKRTRATTTTTTRATKKSVKKPVKGPGRKRGGFKRRTTTTERTTTTKASKKKTTCKPPVVAQGLFARLFGFFSSAGFGKVTVTGKC